MQDVTQKPLTSEAEEAVEQARKHVADLLNADPRPLCHDRCPLT